MGHRFWVPLQYGRCHNKTSFNLPRLTFTIGMSDSWLTPKSQLLYLPTSATNADGWNEFAIM